MTVSESQTTPSAFPRLTKCWVVSVTALACDNFGNNSETGNGFRVFTRISATVRKADLIGIADQGASRRSSSQCPRREFAEQLATSQSKTAKHPFSVFSEYFADRCFFGAAAPLNLAESPFRTPIDTHPAMNLDRRVRTSCHVSD
jgi:hypothetical protein